MKSAEWYRNNIVLERPVHSTWLERLNHKELHRVYKAQQAMFADKIPYEQLRRVWNDAADAAANREEQRLLDDEFYAARPYIR